MLKTSPFLLFNTSTPKSKSDFEFPSDVPTVTPVSDPNLPKRKPLQLIPRSSDNTTLFNPAPNSSVNQLESASVLNKRLEAIVELPEEDEAGLEKKPEKNTATLSPKPGLG